MARNENANYDEDLRARVGHDATSSFEDDANFTNNIPTANASSENVRYSGSPDEALLSGETSRHPEGLENAQDRSLLDESDETATDRDTGYDRRSASPQAESDSDIVSEDDEDEDDVEEDEEEDEEDESDDDDEDSEDEDELEDDVEDEEIDDEEEEEASADLSALGHSQPISQDETRPEGEADVSRKRGGRKAA